MYKEIRRKNRKIKANHLYLKMSQFLINLEFKGGIQLPVEFHQSIWTPMVSKRKTRFFPTSPSCPSEYYELISTGLAFAYKHLLLPKLGTDLSQIILRMAVVLENYSSLKDMICVTTNCFYLYPHFIPIILKLQNYAHLDEHAFRDILVKIIRCYTNASENEGELLFFPHEKGRCLNGLDIHYSTNAYTIWRKYYMW